MPGLGQQVVRATFESTRIVQSLGMVRVAAAWPYPRANDFFFRTIEDRKTKHERRASAIHATSTKWVFDGDEAGLTRTVVRLMHRPHGAT